MPPDGQGRLALCVLLTVDATRMAEERDGGEWLEYVSRWERPLTLVSLVAALLAELAELAADTATWCFDALNWLELPSLLIAAVGTAAAQWGWWPQLEQDLVGISLAPIWLVPLLRLMLLSPQLGPLVLMSFKSALAAASNAMCTRGCSTILESIPRKPFVIWTSTYF